MQTPQSIIEKLGAVRNPLNKGWAHLPHSATSFKNILFIPHHHKSKKSTDGWMDGWSTKGRQFSFIAKSRASGVGRPEVWSRILISRLCDFLDT